LSTILKSLKKLEQEKEAKRYQVQAAGYTGPGAVADAGGPPSRRTKSTWIRRSLVVLLILGLGASSVYFYRQSVRKAPSVSDTAKASRLPEKPTASGTLEKRSVNNPPQAKPRPMAKAQGQPTQKIQSPARRPAAEQAPVTSASNRLQDPAIRAEPAAQPPSPSERPLQDPKPAVTPTPTHGDKIAQTQEMPQRRQVVDNSRKRPPKAALPTEQHVTTAKSRKTDRAEPKTEVRPSDAYDDLRPLTDGKLKIQAIVWSDTQGDRMAVINTQIVHEGGSVDGFDVVTIRPEDVVVRGEAGGMYRVLFGHP
jgi:hypothetical protein